MEEFSTVWLATPSKFHRPLKMFPYDEQGRLQVARNEIRFVGNRKSMLISKIEQLNLVRQPAPWLNWVVSNGLIILGIASGFFKTITWQDPLTVPLLVGINLFMVLIWWTDKWVAVEYLDDAGQPQKLFLNDGTMFGWGAHFGGTKKIHSALESCSSPKADPDLTR